MAGPKVALPADISRAEFDVLLSRYTSLIEAISEAKPAKDGQRTLQLLDEFRYVEALETFGTNDSDRSMGLEDVEHLVEWKLRHGKFRPKLLSLVSSNDPEFTQKTIQTALNTYRERSDISASLGTLSKLKGVGPATASLLLTVHDPSRVIFFSDEAFYWLCCGGKKSPIKYNAKEYAALDLKAHEMVKRLGVSATDIEKVAYVVMKSSEYPIDPSSPGVAEEETETISQTTSKATKRRSKSVSDAPHASAPARRSKRFKT